MRTVLHNGKEIFNGRTVDIPKVYELVTGQKLNKKEWFANSGKLDGLEWAEWLEKNNVEIKVYDSIWKLNKE